jgi:hypothetical protein
MSRAGFSSKCWRVLRWAGLAAAAPALWACTSRTLEAPVITPTATVTTNFTQKINNEIDILFMVDNSSSMTEMQQKLYDQLPTFMQVLESIPNPPSLHVAVVSSDMGAPGDSTGSIMCTSFGDNGAFQSSPRSDSKLGITCTDSTLATPQNQQNNDNTFISDDNGVKNFTDPDISTVFQCIAFLGDTGCGFEHQLASIDHALGSDNFQPDPNNPGQLIPSPPSTNAGFLRPEAYLGIVILTNEDDCSAPQNTQLYSLNVGGSGQQNIMNALGPIQNYRCNEFGHLCKDPASGDPNALIEPPLNPPNDHQGTAAAPLLAMTDCQSNDTNGLTTPVQQFIDDVKKLKTDPDNQILVAAISAPTAPYAVAWIPEVNGQNTQPGELWPEVLHSCGAIGGPDVNPDPKTQNASDGSFGDPGVRISQFVSAFPNFVQASICDPSYAQSMTAIATKLGQLITPPCITGKIQTDSSGNPMCSVTEHLTDMQGTKSDRTVPGCASNGGALPCWTLAGSTTAGCNGQSLTVTDEPGVSTNMESSTINCSLCLPNSTEPGC